MISSLKTPGVYVFEQDAFPPSVAQVETAIPAFIGFTEKKPEVDSDKPTRIKSLNDFEDKFGQQSKPKSITINYDSDKYEVEESKFKLYGSIQLFYANGGGVCYIVSIGKYDDNPPFIAATKTKFNNGIKLLEKVDEITLISFPDAINLSVNNLKDVQETALNQCGKLMDRFAILDVIQTSGADIDADIESFRNALGNKSLKYGAAYYPYLKTSFTYKFRFKDINGTGPDKVNFRGIYASDPDMINLLDEFDDLHTDIRTTPAGDGLIKDWETSTANNAKVPVNDEASVLDYTDKLWNLLAVLGKPDDFNSSKMTNTIDDAIPLSLTSHTQDLVDFKAAYQKLKKPDGAADVDDLTELDEDVRFESNWGTIKDMVLSNPNPYENGAISKQVALVPAGPGNVPPAVPGHKAPDFAKIKTALDKVFNNIIASVNSIITQVKDLEEFEENNLTSNILIWPKIINGLSNSMANLPPSGAIAGVYANVDFTRGVWKAPANVTITGIDGFTADINDKDQESMNIHETGKSVNALRAFTGRGKYVWGARTLDGNSNDWRYINVRRLAIMIEESAKKACFNFVFEPNVKQTWVRVKGMIENFLTILWRDGALAGAKPEHAFFVHVGLDLTMNQDDINNGRMIVKIGYAPSRPAEFIALVFTQKQQES